MKKCLILLALACYTLGVTNEVCAQNAKKDSLMVLLEKDKEDTMKVIHLFQLTRECELAGNFVEGLSDGKEAMALAQKLNYKRGMANACNNIGNIYLKQGDYTNAIDNYQKALGIDEELNNKKGSTTRLGNIGIVYYEQGDYSNALDFFFQALKNAEELLQQVMQNSKTDPNEIVKCKTRIEKQLGNIGNVYKDQGDFPKALDYYFKALKINEAIGNKGDAAINLGNIGTVYHMQKDFPKALECYLKALKTDEELGNTYGIARHLGHLGVFYKDLAKTKVDAPAHDSLIDKSIFYFFEALKMDAQLENRNGVARHLANIGSLYTNTGNYKEAFVFLYRALEIDDSIGVDNGIKEDYEMLSFLYEKSTIVLPDSTGGQLLNREEMRLRSLHYFKSYINLRDTLFSQENKKQLVRKEMNFEFEKKQAATKAENDKKEALAKEELKQKENERNYFIAGFGLVLLLAGFIFRSYRQKQKANEIISRQKSLVEEKQKEILDSIHYAKRIQKSLLPTEKYIGRNLKRLRNN